MTAYQGAAAFKRISNVIDKDISIKENKNFPNLKRNSNIILKS